MKRYLSWLIILTLAAVLVLACLPEGVEMHFMAPPEEDVPYYVSFAPYFSLLPYGYGNFGPLITAVLAAIAFVLSVIRLFCGSRKILSVVFILSIIAAVVSVTPMIFGSYTLIGGFITVMLAVLVALTGALLKLTKGGE